MVPLVAVALAALPVAGDPVEVVFDLAPFYLETLSGSLPGTCGVVGTVIGARIDVAFVSYEAASWNLDAVFHLPTGSAGFSAAAQGWSGPGYFQLSQTTHAFDGALVHASGGAHFDWSFAWTCSSPVVLPNGYVVHVPVDGGFTDLRLTLTIDPPDPCAPAKWFDLGHGLHAGASAPRLLGVGDLCSAGTPSLAVADGPPSATAIAVLGAGFAGLPLFGGVLVPTPDVVTTVVLDSAGTLELPLPFACHLPPGTSIHSQVWILDGSAPGGLTATNGLRLDLP
jgi:hypothetical protein